MIHDHYNADALEAEATNRALAAVQERDADYERLIEFLDVRSASEHHRETIERYFLDGHTVSQCLHKLQALTRP